MAINTVPPTITGELVIKAHNRQKVGIDHFGRSFLSTHGNPVTRKNVGYGFAIT